MGRRPPFDQADLFQVSAVLPIPSSWSAKKQQLAVAGEILPTGRPDLDNVAKAVKDALNGVVYRDDAMITASALKKV
jgi:Holliday junction resolvase RusA-like endonuclease